MPKSKSFIDGLNDADKLHLIDAPVLITFLVAGSDNNLDQKERDWAERLVEFRAERNEPALLQYYSAVEENWTARFEHQAKILLDFDVADLRNRYLSEELSKVNAILHTLPGDAGDVLYKSLKSFSRQVAQSSGGIFGIGSVSPAEGQWMNLPMLHSPKG